MHRIIFECNPTYHNQQNTRLITLGELRSKTYFRFQFMQCVNQLFCWLKYVGLLGRFHWSILEWLCKFSILESFSLNCWRWWNYQLGCWGDGGDYVVYAVHQTNHIWVTFIQFPDGTFVHTQILSVIIHHLLWLIFTDFGKSMLA